MKASPMPEKHSHSKGRRGEKSVSSGHGAFKHTAKPATLQDVLDAFGLKRDSFEKTRASLLKQLGSESVHAR